MIDVRLALIEYDLRTAKARLVGLSFPDLEKIIDKAIEIVVDKRKINGE